MKTPSNAADECSLHFPNLKHAQDEFFVTHQIPKYIVAWLGIVGSALFGAGTVEDGVGRLL